MYIRTHQYTNTHTHKWKWSDVQSVNDWILEIELCVCVCVQVHIKHIEQTEFICSKIYFLIKLCCAMCTHANAWLSVCWHTFHRTKAYSRIHYAVTAHHLAPNNKLKWTARILCKWLLCVYLLFGGSNLWQFYFLYKVNKHTRAHAHTRTHDMCHNRMHNATHESI